MRHLIIMRHAEAGYAATGQKDFDRPLTERGIQSVLNQAKWLLDHNIIPDRVLCSPSLRTKTTWEVLEKKLEARLPLDFEMTLPPHLYQASPATLRADVQKTQEKVDNLLLIGHNPGVHELAIDMSEPLNGQAASPFAMQTRMAYPPATMTIFEFHGRDWFEADHTNMRIAHYLAPKI